MVSCPVSYVQPVFLLYDTHLLDLDALLEHDVQASRAAASVSHSARKCLTYEVNLIVLICRCGVFFSFAALSGAFGGKFMPAMTTCFDLLTITYSSICYGNSEHGRHLWAQGLEVDLHY